MGYSRKTSNYPERIALSNPSHMTSMADPITSGVKTLRIDSGCPLDKYFTKLIHINPLIVIIPNIQLG